MGEHLGWRRATCQANGGEVRLLLVAASAAGWRGRKSFHGNGTLEQQRREWLIVAIPWKKEKKNSPCLATVWHVSAVPWTLCGMSWIGVLPFPKTVPVFPYSSGVLNRKRR